MESNNKNQPLWKRKLEERGILKEALEVGCVPQKYYNIEGVSFPLYASDGYELLNLEDEPIYIWKNMSDESSNPKYAWINRREGLYAPPYYILPRTKRAITEANGTCFIANGIPATLAYRAGGIRNAMNWLNGEGSIPEDIVYTLKDFGVRKAVYPYDDDNAGRQSGERFFSALEGSGIECQLVAPLEGTEESADINDLWITCGLDVRRFQQTLSQMMQNSKPHENLAPPSRPRPTGSRNTVLLDAAQPNNSRTQYKSKNAKPIEWEEERRLWWVEVGLPAIETAAPVVKRIGGFEFRHCPVHSDEHPSFRISYDRHSDGYPVCTCGIDKEPHAREIAADAAGAEPFMDWWKRERRSLYSYSRSEDEACLEEVEAVIQVPPVSKDFDTAIQTNSDEDKPSTEKTMHSFLVPGHKKPNQKQLGDQLIAYWGGEYKFFRNSWYHYENGYWQKVGKLSMKQYFWDVQEIYHDRGLEPTDARTRGINSYCEAFSNVADEQIDNAPEFINLLNGLYNLQTGRLESFRPELYLVSHLNYAYDSKATCPKWQKFLREVLIDPDTGDPDPELIDFLQEAVGYSLTGETRYQVSFWLHGKTSSGKSTILNVLEALLGSTAIGVDMEQLNKDTWQLADLPGKRVMICRETRSRSTVRDDLLKLLISGETISARNLYERYLRFIPILKIWWAMNDFPQIYDPSGAIERRLRIIPFHRPFTGNEVDIYLFDSLKQELPGILNWALEGLARLNLNRGFTVSKQIQQASHVFRQTVDVEGAFLEAMTERDPQASIQSDALYEAYREWCTENGHAYMTQKAVSRVWIEHGLKRLPRKAEGNFYGGAELKQIN